MEIPKIFIKDSKKYYFVKEYKNFIMYQTKEGIIECFTLNELGLLQEMIEPPRRAYKDGEIIVR